MKRIKALSRSASPQNFQNFQKNSKINESSDSDTLNGVDNIQNGPSGIYIPRRSRYESRIRNESSMTRDSPTGSGSVQGGLSQAKLDEKTFEIVKESILIRNYDYKP